jgi:hypothetical protein
MEKIPRFWVYGISGAYPAPEAPSQPRHKIYHNRGNESMLFLFDIHAGNGYF